MPGCVTRKKDWYKERKDAKNAKDTIISNRAQSVDKAIMHYRTYNNTISKAAIRKNR